MNRDSQHEALARAESGRARLREALQEQQQQSAAVEKRLRDELSIAHAHILHLEDLQACTANARESASSAKSASDEAADQAAAEKHRLMKLVAELTSEGSALREELAEAQREGVEAARLRAQLAQAHASVAEAEARAEKARHATEAAEAEADGASRRRARAAEAVTAQRQQADAEVEVMRRSLAEAELWVEGMLALEQAEVRLSVRGEIEQLKAAHADEMSAVKRAALDAAREASEQRDELCAAMQAMADTAAADLERAKQQAAAELADAAEAAATELNAAEAKQAAAVESARAEVTSQLEAARAEHARALLEAEDEKRYAVRNATRIATANAGPARWAAANGGVEAQSMAQLDQLWKGRLDKAQQEAARAVAHAQGEAEMMRSRADALEAQLEVVKKQLAASASTDHVHVSKPAIRFIGHGTPSSNPVNPHNLD